MHPSGPTALWMHHEHKHPRIYQELKGYLDPEKADVGESLEQAGQRTVAAKPFSDERKQECDIACARWLVKSARPITLPESDKAFRDFICKLTRGAWEPPNHKNVKDKILMLSGQGQLRLRAWFEGMCIDGVKPSIAGDIWSDHGCSIMGICMYGINKQWQFKEWLAAATPFGSTRHHGEAIDSVTKEALERQGIKWRVNGSIYEAVHGKVSDNASNMKKGWNGFDGGYCADHTIELSVKCFTGAEGIKQVFSRCKGIVAYFHRSTAGTQDLQIVQKQLSLAEKSPVQDVATRWFSSYCMVQWFREQQQAIQVYDVQHGTEASKNDAYKDNRLLVGDWAIVEQSEAVLCQFAAATKLLEGTSYVTVSLVLPYVYRLLEASDDNMLYLHWKPPGKQWLPRAQIDPQVRSARKCLHEDMKRRWLTDMPTPQRTELDISTLLDPRFKNYKFPGLQFTDLSRERDNAIQALQGVWAMNWKPVSIDPATGTAIQGSPNIDIAVRPPAAVSSKKQTSCSGFFAMPIGPSDAHRLEDDAAAPDEESESDLDKYLKLPQETDLDLDVLQWWKQRDHSLPADPASGRPIGLPQLAKMARQYLGRPASSAGVERMFSKAGKLHASDKLAQADESLEHAMFASANCE